MADDTNIDEILKSIDALLKEGGAENDSDEVAGEQSSNVRGDIATNDDDLSDCKIPDTEEHPEAEKAEADEQQLEVDAQTEDASAIDTLSGQMLEQEHGVKRIVLSESMVVEEKPELPLDVAGIETAIGEDQSENRVLGEVFSDEPNPDHVAADDFSEGEAENSGEWSKSEDISSPEVAENEEPSVDMSELHINELVEQITSEVSARLQQQLPGMVAGMVAEAMQKNLAAHAVTDNESSGDTQN